MSNTRKTPGERISSLQKGYEERIARQVDIISRFQARTEAAEAQAASMRIFVLALADMMDRDGADEFVFSFAHLSQSSPDDWQVIPREDGGVVFRRIPKKENSSEDSE